MDEIWKLAVIEGATFSDGSPKYEVSNHGHVRMRANLSLSGVFNEARLLKEYVDGRGFCSVGVRLNNGKQRRIYTHTLAAVAFLDNPEGLTKVVHIDGNHSNNRVDNLRWLVPGTKPKSETSKGPTAKARHRREAIRQYSEQGEFIAEFPSTTAAARAVYLASGGQISQCCNRLPGHHTCAGYVWRYASDDEFTTKEGVADEVK